MIQVEDFDKCQVCFKYFLQDNYSNYDPIPTQAKIQCKKCKAKAHKYCYAPNIENTLNFICDTCTFKTKKEYKICCICNKQGLLKKVQQFYVHPFCAATSSLFLCKSYYQLSFIPILKSKTNNFLFQSKSSVKCLICKQKSTTERAIKCNKKHCPQFAHFYCVKKILHDKSDNSISWTGKFNWIEQSSQTYQMRNDQLFKWFIKQNYQSCYQLLWGSHKPGQLNLHKRSQKYSFYCKCHQNQISPCSCGQQLTDDLIQCEICQNWQHFKCQKLTKIQIDQMNKNNKVYQCKNCVKWRQGVRNGKILILNKYPLLQFYDLVYIQVCFQKRKYCLLQSEQYLLQRQALKPSLQYYSKFAKKKIYPLIKRRIQTEHIYQILNTKDSQSISQQKIQQKVKNSYKIIKILNAKNFDLNQIEYEDPKKFKLEIDVIKKNLQYFDQIYCSEQKYDEFFTRIETPKINQNRQQTHQKIQQFPNNNIKQLTKYDIKSLPKQLSNIHQYNQLSLLSSSFIEQNTSIPQQDNTNIAQQDRNILNQSYLIQMLNQIRNQKQYRQRLTKIDKFKSLLTSSKCCESIRRKAVNFIHIIQQQKVDLSILYQKYTNEKRCSSQFTAFSILLKYVQLCLTQKIYHYPHQNQKYLLDDLLNKRQKYLQLLSDNQKRSIVLYKCFSQFYNQIKQSACIQIKVEYPISIYNKKYSIISHLQNFTINQTSIKYLLQFLASISCISLKQFPKLLHVLKNKSKIIMEIYNKPNFECLTDLRAFKYINNQLQIKQKWIAEQLFEHQYINKFIDKFKVETIDSYDSCVEWKRKIKEVLIRLEKNHKKMYLKSIIEIFQKVQCLSKIFNQIPQWILFPAKITEDTFQTGYQSIKASKIYQLNNQIKNRNFPHCQIKQRMQDLAILAQRQTQLITRFLSQLNNRISKNKLIYPQNNNQSEFQMADIQAALVQMKSSLIDHCQLISQIQEIIAIFMEYRRKFYKAAKKKKINNMLQLAKLMRNFPFQMPQIIKILKDNKDTNDKLSQESSVVRNTDTPDQKYQYKVEFSSQIVNTDTSVVKQDEKALPFSNLFF